MQFNQVGLIAGLLSAPGTHLGILNRNSLIQEMKIRYLPVIAILPLLVCSCGCDEPTIIDMGLIPDSILSEVPYEDGLIYPFTHSGGKVISFTAQRTSRDEYLYCDRCCDDYSYRYQVNETVLTPDYPVFQLRIQLNSMDSSYYGHSIWIGRHGFYVSVRNMENFPVDYADSLQFNGKWYPGVYSLKNTDSYWMIQDSIRPDSLYYNFRSGIIKIVMTNGEYYQKNE